MKRTALAPQGAHHRLAAPGGFFLRAETMRAYLAQVDASDADGRARGNEKLHQRSHGEDNDGANAPHEQRPHIDA